jgi:EAL and modified HD-GYP domain-containing signal transduction protein
MQSPLDTLGPIIDELKQQKNIKLLAEKIETEEEYEIAKKMGFHFFQGYFFCKTPCY